MKVRQVEDVLFGEGSNPDGSVTLSARDVIWLGRKFQEQSRMIERLRKHERPTLIGAGHGG